MERTQEEQERLGRIVDGLPAWQLMQVMTETVGIKRAGILLGWAAWWGLSGEPGGVELRRKLEAQGMTQASAYRAINDFKRVSDKLLSLEGYAGVGVFASLRQLAATISL